jgi:hypothetical protein
LRTGIGTRIKIEDKDGDWGSRLRILRLLTIIFLWLIFCNNGGEKSYLVQF